MDKINKKVSRIAKIGFLLAAILFVAAMVGTILGLGNNITLNLAGSAFYIGLACILLAWANHRGWFNKNKRAGHFTASKSVRTLSIILIACIITSAFFAIYSLWHSPWQDSFGSGYENITRVFGGLSILIGLLLSGLQQHIYWISRLKSLNLDERQIQERQQVFETSYKLGAIIILIAVYFSGKVIDNLQSFIASHAMTTPSGLIWLLVNLAIIIFSLPLIVAAWQKR